MRRIAIVSAMKIEISYVHEYLEKRDNWEKVNEDTYPYILTGIRLALGGVLMGYISDRLIRLLEKLNININ